MKIWATGGSDGWSVSQERRWKKLSGCYFGAWKRGLGTEGVGQRCWGLCPGEPTAPRLPSDVTATTHAPIYTEIK